MEISLIHGLKLIIRTTGNKYVLVSLNADEVMLLDSWVSIAQFLETLACFVANYLDNELVYEVGPFCIQMVRRDGTMSLRVEGGDVDLYLSKYECKLITCIANRVLARTDVLQNVGSYIEPTSTEKKGQ